MYSFSVHQCHDPCHWRHFLNTCIAICVTVVMLKTLVSTPLRVELKWLCNRSAHVKQQCMWNRDMHLEQTANDMNTFVPHKFVSACSLKYMLLTRHPCNNRRPRNSVCNIFFASGCRRWKLKGYWSPETSGVRGEAGFAASGSEN